MVATIENGKDIVDPPSKPDKIFGVRHGQSLLLFSCLMMAYALRVNISVAIVAMLNNENNPNFPAYPEWKPKKDVILSSFFWGYVVTQIPSAQIVKQYGTYIPLLVTMTLTSLVTIITPQAASLGWGAMAATRVVEGLCQGFFFPSIHTLLSKWIPPSERGRLGTFVYAGNQFGTFLGLPIAGFLAGSKSMGWPSIFYIFGACGLVWSVIWFFFGCNSPSDHKTITEEEKKYIMASLGSRDDHDKKIITPWKSILTSLPMWCVIVAHCANNWGFWTLLTEIPTYMENILDFNLKTNGLLSALPYFVMWLLSFVFSFSSDFLVNRNYISLAASRKIGNTIGHWIPAATLIGLGYMNSDQKTLSVALLTIAVGFNSAVYIGFQVNHIDLSPNHAGTMMGITNCAANIMSIIAPLIVGFIVTDSESSEQWRIIFFISAGIYFCGNLFFVLFGKATVQPWNEVEENYELESRKKSTETNSTNEKNEKQTKF